MKPFPSHSEVAPPPVHVAIIMDGNGRWAKARGLPRTAGHRQGAVAVREAIKSAGDIGIGYLTLYGFSLENWKRPAGEITDLMGLMRLYLRQELRELADRGVRVRFIGDRSRLPDDIVALMADAEERTFGNTALNLIVAMSYGSRQEITEAARRLVAEAATGRLDAAAVTSELLERHLATAGIPDPDLIIRTSGEKRISNFLLWQAAYSELVFIDTLWPDFSRADLEGAIREYHRRERRYGAAGG
ncbi:MAG: isoprenyl transferase [Rhodospirillales bacterium]